MSLYSIKEYQQEVEKIIHFGGTKKETAIRNAFYNLLNDYAKAKGLMIVTEVSIKATNSNRTVTPDGTLKDMLRQDWGYWESKDESDVLDDEVKKKFEKGYPKENILFEDSQTAILFQNGIEILRVSMKDAEALHHLVTVFVNFERPEVKNFRQAIELFKQDIPKVTDVLREIIETAEKDNSKYIQASEGFLKLCQESINPEVNRDDVREMIIQHILTEDVFNTIFDETQFHRENNVARELESVINTFFTGSIRKSALQSVQHYYQAINATAAGIVDHHEKQKFLKVIYETFYKSYNPKAADRLGVVYTPNEIVQFMIKSTDYLLHKHFNKFLEDKNVEILDPATGTGTFICDIIDSIPKDKLEYKYKNELHANEVAILPYYISNLNIEFTYTQKMGKYAEFENLCFVDTLDNLGFTFEGKQLDMFTPLNEENSKRIRKQNGRKIAVVIGNPPYNANQMNENDNNKNREYPGVDKRIKETYIKFSTAKKTKLYDMYARFYRWAMDRMDSNGIIAFITNRSFIDKRTFDGFRKCVQNDFDFAYIIDTQSDVRDNPKISGTTHNVFGIQTGVAIMFLVRKANRDKKAQCNIQYISLPDEWRKEDKLQWLTENPLKDIPFSHIQPDKKNNWLNLIENDWSKFIGLDQIFNVFSPGVNTARDEWVFDLDESDLIFKVDHLINEYNILLEKGDKSFPSIFKWSESLKKAFSKGKKLELSKNLVRAYMYRPFFKVYYYGDKSLSDRLTSKHLQFVGAELKLLNKIICFSGPNASKPFSILSVENLCSFDFLEKTQMLSLYQFDSENNKKYNITDFSLKKFQNKFHDDKITKEDIFYYVYALLHDPAYRLKYEINLKHEFPRIPFYKGFQKWCNWGKSLMDLHINFETVESFNLVEITTDKRDNPKTKLKADKENGLIILDENTSLSGIPAEAWLYKLGNRSALEWVLDQYKEKKSSDPTIEEKFNTYRFADYKMTVIDLLRRVCTVSLETVRILREMEALSDSDKQAPEKEAGKK